ncbi:MAG TPA: hypothetical protein DCP67_11165 [Planctomycetaceae bacterium]|nr:hypothetical protein [Rhodopirellula sp.]MCH2361478.1 hypothetical protein [Pirellulales bacterium]HAL14361.1 hypothetical protein [Planctomycetaceae bacterium]HCK72066.1 hypothetical protein [Planctomycetaceae bacterium]HCP84587.1 hypothetical protein [Planctomycetaceae bacterium]
MIQTIIKVGGSLLDLPDLNNRLQTWLRQFDITPAWLMCGGGEYADSIRARQPWAGWCDAEAHDLAVLAMDANTYETSELLGLKVVELAYPQSEQHEADYTAIAASHFLNDAEPQCEGVVLPQNWSATSDSIAARIATVFEIPNVVLLKSAAPPSEDLETLQDCGYIDSAFISMLRENTNVQFINLRE